MTIEIGGLVKEMFPYRIALVYIRFSFFSSKEASLV